MDIPSDALINETESLCPVCLAPVKAAIYEKNGRVHMAKTCLEHGDFDVYLWPDADHYRWCATFDFPATTRSPQTETAQGCPRDCGLCNSHRNWISLAEVEVTYRCNMECPLCFMAAGGQLAEPSLSSLKRQIASIKEHEYEKVTLQITGGEPTVREDLFELLRFARDTGFETIEVNSNGIVLGQDPSYAAQLREAGCSNVYLQFDGVTEDVTDRLRRPGMHALKLAALENCRAAGLPVILCPTVVRGVNDGQLADIIAFAFQNDDVVQGISFQPAFESGRFDVECEERLGMGDMVALIEEQTGGNVKARDFYPLNCVSPLCDCSTYLIGDSDFYYSLARGIDEQEYRSFFKDGSTQGSTFVDVALRKYKGIGIPRGIPVLIMCFMDAWTFDAARAARCNLGVSTSDGRSIPFCSYHLSDAAGRRLYPYPAADGQRS